MRWMYWALFLGAVIVATYRFDGTDHLIVLGLIIAATLAGYIDRDTEKEDTR